MDDSRDNKKNRFSNTMAFMEEYLNNVLNDELPFHNEEKNKLTYEVVSLARHLIYFGFYSFFELLRLTRTLLGIIDCRPNPGHAGLLFHDDGSGKNVKRSIHGMGQMMSTMVLNRKQSIFGGTSAGGQGWGQGWYLMDREAPKTFILNVRLDYRLSFLLSVFKKEFVDVYPMADADATTNMEQAATINLQHIGEQAEAMFGVGKGNSILEVDDEGGRMFLRVLTHLTMHDYPPLVSGALQLLFRHFSQRQEVLHTFKQADLDRLRTLVEKSELWVEKKSSGGGDGKKDKKDKKEKGEGPSEEATPKKEKLEKGNENYQKVKEILERLNKMCSSGVWKKQQRLLKNMGAHKVMLDLLQVSYDQNDVKMQEIIRYTHLFLQKFCMGNQENQVLLHKNLNLFLNPGLLEAETVQHIFSNNYQLCTEISESVLQHFIHCLATHGRHVQYLNFLHTIIKAEGKYVKKSSFNVMLELMAESREGVSENSPLRYHISLVELLAACAEGKNVYTEIKCTSLLPLEDVVRVVTHEDCITEVKVAYVNFVNHCYVDTEVEMKEIYTSNHIWKLFEDFTVDMARVCNKRDKRLSDPVLEKYIINVVFDTINAFFSSPFSENSTSLQTHHTIVTQLLQSSVRLLDCPWLQQQHRGQVETCIKTLAMTAKSRSISLPLDLEAQISSMLSSSALNSLSRSNPNYKSSSRLIQHTKALMSSEEKLCIKVLRTLQEMLIRTLDFDEKGIALRKVLLQNYLFPNKKNNPKNDLAELGAAGGDQERDWAAVAAIQCRLDREGGTKLFTDLVMSTKNDKIFQESIQLAICLLEGGNTEIQVLHDRMKEAQTDIKATVSVNVGEMTHKANEKELENGGSTTLVIPGSGHPLLVQGQSIPPVAGTSALAVQSVAEQKEVETEMGPAVTIMKPILRFLQLLCENHNQDLQNFLRCQNNKTNYNLVCETLQFLDIMCGSTTGGLGLLGLYINESNVHLIIQTLETLTEYCQGPCQENQTCIVTHESNGIDIITALILNDISPLCRYQMEMVLQLKDNASKLLLALMESRHDSENAERILFNLRPRELMEVIKKAYHQESECEGVEVSPREVGHNIYILAQQLARHNKILQNLLKPLKKNKEGEEGISSMLNLNNRPLSQMLKSTAPAAVVEQDPLEFYEQLTAQIEIVREDRSMEQIVFPVHPICEFLTEESKFRVFNTTEQDEQGSKVTHFFEQTSFLHGEMEWQKKLRSMPRYGLQPLTVALILRSIYHLGIGNTLILLGSLNLLNKVVFVVSFVGNNGTFIMGYKAMVMDVEFLYHLAYVLTSTLGLFVHELFYSILLFDLIYREETLFNVIKSVTRNGRSILLTALLALILVYLFSIVGFLCLKEDFIMEVDPLLQIAAEGSNSERACDTLLMCIVTVLNHGLRNGGGVGDVLRAAFPARVVYDLLFYFIVIIIVLNLIFGVIIDTFADLRSEKQKKEEILKTTCFICGLERDKFDNKTVSFEEHIKLEHNIWNYLYFTFWCVRKPRQTTLD
ncbi:hypothetical protein INR49_023906 [Caranx melampygus]|nr:hypothetical protein INR49_023906 [Caranx melampygus]